MSTELKTEEINKKWYQKPVGVGFLVWLFFPVGLYFMWKENVWSSKARIIITSVFSLFIIFALAGQKSDNSNFNSKKDNTNPQLAGLTFAYYDEIAGVAAILVFDNEKDAGFSTIVAGSDFKMASLGKYIFNESTNTITFSWKKIGPKEAKVIIKDNNIVELIVAGPSGTAIYELLTD